MGKIIGEPLAKFDGRDTKMLFESFSEEKGRICWDMGGSEWGNPTLVKITDWMSDSWSGERRVLVTQLFPRGMRGLAWERSQSDLRVANVNFHYSMDDQEGERLSLLAAAQVCAEELSDVARIGEPILKKRL